MQDTNRSQPNAAALVWDWRDRLTRQAGAEAREVAAARKRGAIGLAVGLAVATLFYWGLHRPLLAEVVAGIAGLLALLALAFPRTLYRQAMKGIDLFAHGVATAVTWILMTLLHLLLFLPVGLVLRAGGKLGITRHYDPKLPSYWKDPKARTADLESYRRQF